LQSDGWRAPTSYFTTHRPRVPVLVELGEDWIVGRMGASYRRYIQDFDF
jgi:hypothetical protein